jgi:hypothetical protein
MTNEPILKNAKMNITNLLEKNYKNPYPIGQKKTNPFSPDPPKPVPSKLSCSSKLVPS